MSLSVTIKHAGDLGDIIYFLPCARSYADDSGPVTILLDPYQAQETGMKTRMAMTMENAAGLIPLLESQKYIQIVRPLFPGEEADVDGNSWRSGMYRLLKNQNTFHSVRTINLCRWQRERLGIAQRYEDEPWLLDIAPNEIGFDIIINRTFRYRNEDQDRPGDKTSPRRIKFPWRQIVEQYDGRCCFIGHPDEHADFCAQFGDVPYWPTDDLLQAAQIIKGAKLFIGNQSCCFAIAEGMKHPSALEVFPFMPNCNFGRKEANVVHGYDASALDAIKNRFKL